MALRRPEKWGGPAVSELVFRRYQEQIARVSGALAFLQTQHQSAGSMLANSENEAIMEEYLPKMGNGEKLVGIGFSQLRRPGPPLMRAEETDGGYLLNGKVPWVTGYSFYPEYLIGAQLPDGRAVFAIVPLPTTELAGMKVSEPMGLAAMESAQTVSIDYENFFVPHEKVAFVKPAGWIQNNDMINIALQGSFAMGCAMAGLDIVNTNAQKKNVDFLIKAHAALQEELNRCRAWAEELRPQVNEETTNERLALRAWQIELMARCAQAAVVSSSGAANSSNHPAQRVFRESMVFTVSAQTSAIMEASIKRLISE